MISSGMRRPKSASEMIRQADLWRIGADGDQNFVQAFQLYKKAAARGNTRAMFLLGTMYESGHGTKQSYREAAKWYDRGCEEGDIDCAAAIAFLSEAGLGVKRSRTYAIEMNERAALAGNVRAENNLGLIYLDPDGGDLNLHAAMTWFQKGNISGFAPAQANLGRMYQKGMNVNRSCGTAAVLFKRAAKQGNTGSKIHLARLYRLGLGVDRSETVARHLFLEAARWGSSDARKELEEDEGEPYDPKYSTVLKRAEDPQSQLEIGLAYLDGICTGQSVYTAVYWLEQAAKGGSETAMYVLGQIYENGICLEKSPGAAAKWYRWGADRGHGPCAYNLAYMYENGIGGPKDPEKAFALYRKASEDASSDEDALSDALFAVGSMMLRGNGTEKDPAGAVTALSRSAELGHAGAQLLAGKVLMPSDRGKAVSFLRMAADQGDPEAARILSELEERGPVCGTGTSRYRLPRIAFMQDDRDTVAQWH